MENIEVCNFTYYFYFPNAQFYMQFLECSFLLACTGWRYYIFVHIMYTHALLLLLLLLNSAMNPQCTLCIPNEEQGTYTLNIPLSKFPHDCLQEFGIK